MAAPIGGRYGPPSDDGDGGRVVTPEHERPKPWAPPGGDLRSGRVELLARWRSVRQLAVANVGQGQVLEVPAQDG